MQSLVGGGKKKVQSDQPLVIGQAKILLTLLKKKNHYLQIGFWSVPEAGRVAHHRREAGVVLDEEAGVSSKHLLQYPHFFFGP